MTDKKHFKYPDIERLGSDENKDILFFGEDDVLIEEKVDGGNGSFWIDNETKIVFEASRNRNLSTDKDEKTFIKQRISLREILTKVKLNPDYIYYIEWMQKHTINYTTSPNFIGIDIRLKHNINGEGCGLFLGRETREKEFKSLGIENIPLIWRGKAKDLKKEEINKLIPKSKYYDGLAEGIVIKNYTRKANNGNHQLYAKVVRDEFKECNRAVFGGVKNKNTDTAKIIEEYCTEARIRKHLFKLINEEGMKLEMALMKYLPTAVTKDILKEEFTNIYERYKFIDFKEMRQKIPKNCLVVLQEEIALKVGK